MDYGSYHEETVSIRRDVISRYDRLIDCLREDPDVLQEIHVDVGRLCAAYLSEAEG